MSLALPGYGGAHASMAAMRDMAPVLPAWSLMRGAVTFSMWWIMMLAMMLPSAAPTILLYSRAAANARMEPAAGSFLAGYLAAWGGFAAGATVMQFLLVQTGLVAPDMLALQNRTLSGTVFIAAGLYQVSPLKNACLRRCRHPAQFLSAHFRSGSLGALRMGALHGSICVGCCWLLMALLFVGGIMNLAWIALLTAMVAAERLLRFGQGVAVLAGLACLGWGAWLLLT